MSIRKEYEEVTLTLEQAAAMRAILKLEQIHTVGEWMRASKELEPIRQLESVIFLTDRWATMDRPFATAMTNFVMSDEKLRLDSPIKVLLNTLERRMVSDLLFMGHFRKSIDDAKKEASDYVKSFISIVLIDRNYAALKQIFPPIPVEDHQQEGPPTFWFEQTSPKGVVN